MFAKLLRWLRKRTLDVSVCGKCTDPAHCEECQGLAAW